MDSKPPNERPLDATHGVGDARLFQPKESMGTRVAVVGVLAIALAGGGYWWWRQHSAEPAAATPAGPATVAVAPPAPAPASAAPAILHPIDAAGQAASGAPALPPLDQADAAVTRALTDLLGTRQVAAMLQLDGFVRRVVATVDNLDRAHASPSLWPVAPTTGKFSVRHAGDNDVIAQDNDVRYAVFVRFVESIDTARAVALYVRLYPLFQQAYQELGYPHGYFNDRLVAVIDRLLATPEPSGPVALHLTEVKGPMTSQRPWVHYGFADPALEALPAGSKMLLRMGPDHARRLKLKLAEWRRALATAPPKS
jgi:Protein of unknown function (DUF3014)